MSKMTDDDDVRRVFRKRIRDLTRQLRESGNEEVRQRQRAEAAEGRAAAAEAARDRAERQEAKLRADLAGERAVNSKLQVEVQHLRRERQQSLLGRLIRGGRTR